MLRGDGVRSSAVAKYLKSAMYRRQVEFEGARHSQSGICVIRDGLGMSMRDFSPVDYAAYGVAGAVLVSLAHHRGPFGHRPGGGAR
ncbi:hypothetical protein ACLOJK_004580 [Asimina triloba]